MTVLAPLGSRALARLCDLVVVGYAVALIYVEVVHRHLTPGSSGNLLDAARRWEVALRVTVVVVFALYEGVPVHLVGRTLGKAVLGLRVADAGTSARPRLRASMARLILPMVVVLGPLVVWPVALVVWLTAAVRPDGRGLPDLLAGTQVVGPVPVPGP